MKNRVNEYIPRIEFSKFLKLRRDLPKTGDNNASTRAFYILVNFFSVPFKTATSNDQIIGFCGEREHTTINILFSILRFWTHES